MTRNTIVQIMDQLLEVCPRFVPFSQLLLAGLERLETKSVHWVAVMAKASVWRIQLYRTVLTAKIGIFQKSIKTLIDHSKVIIYNNI